MRKTVIPVVAAVVFLMGGFLSGTKLMPVRGQNKPGAGFAAIPGDKGGQDIFGPYEIVKDWPKPISGLPGNEK